MVLIDAGCEYQGYAADITRTFPVSGKYSAEQAAIYEVVLEAQRVAIEACQIGNTYNQPHDKSLEIIVQGLRDLKLLKGSQEEIMETRSYTEFYMHRVGHWLGMDVHDAGDYKVEGADSSWREFEAGMVTTIEPGIYIQPDNKKVPAKWRGIGVRIEDDIAIRKSGPENMTASVPKAIADIEHLMQS